jgi:hypothetical protein
MLFFLPVSLAGNVISTSIFSHINLARGIQFIITFDKETVLIIIQLSDDPDN